MEDAISNNGWERARAASEERDMLLHFRRRRHRPWRSCRTHRFYAKGRFAGQKAHAQHPELVLVGLNEALCGKFEEHFVTAAYLYADLDAKIIRYAGAGHPPLLLSNRSNDEVRSVERNGFFLGMFPEAVYSSIEISLQQGDRCVLYTDGLPESTNAEGEEFGLPRCKQFLGSHSRLPSAELADLLLSEIACWSARSSGRPQEDDMTLLIIDWQGQS